MLHQAPIVAAQRTALALAAGLGLLLACAPETGAPDADWPAGALLSARRAALDRVLSQVESLQGTPAARLARELRRALPGCPDLEARADDVAGLRGAMRCAGADGAPALGGLHRYRGTDDVALAIPLAAGPRLLLRAREEAGHLRARLHWPDPDLAPSLAALLPGGEAAGPPVLAVDERVLHARVRGDGALDLSALVPPGSQADQLFRLRNDVLSAALLDGTWELAIYPPLAGARMPRVAAALGVRVRGPAVVAARRFLDDVQATWSLQRTVARFGEREGVCLLGLRLLPDLAPCLVATERALVLGWNAESLRHALAARPSGDGAPAPPARLEVDLARLRESDLRLAAAHGGAVSGAAAVRWPWRRLVARASRGDGALSVELDLEAGDPVAADGARGS